LDVYLKAVLIGIYYDESVKKKKELLSLKPAFHFAHIVAKRTGEHAQIEKRFIKPRTSGCIRVSK
jgi:hypothetical protein